MPNMAFIGGCKGGLVILKILMNHDFLIAEGKPLAVQGGQKALAMPENM